MFRAPEWSINERSLWALGRWPRKAIASTPAWRRCKIVGDGRVSAPSSSAAHAGRTDYGGTAAGRRPVWPGDADRLGLGASHELAAAGAARASSAVNRAGLPAVLTVHPWELDPDPPRVRLPARLQFAHYFRLERLSGRGCARFSRAPRSAPSATSRAPPVSLCIVSSAVCALLLVPVRSVSCAAATQRPTTRLRRLRRALAIEDEPAGRRRSSRSSERPRCRPFPVAVRRALSPGRSRRSGARRAPRRHSAGDTAACGCRCRRPTAQADVATLARRAARALLDSSGASSRLSRSTSTVSQPRSRASSCRWPRPKCAPVTTRSASPSAAPAMADRDAARRHLLDVELAPYVDLLAIPDGGDPTVGTWLHRSRSARRRLLVDATAAVGAATMRRAACSKVCCNDLGTDVVDARLARDRLDAPPSLRALATMSDLLDPRHLGARRCGGRADRSASGPHGRHARRCRIACCSTSRRSRPTWSIRATRRASR